MFKCTHTTLATGKQNDLSSVVPASVLFLPEIHSTPGIDCVLSTPAKPNHPPPALWGTEAWLSVSGLEILPVYSLTTE